jgi:hypothetical protein
MLSHGTIATETLQADHAPCAELCNVTQEISETTPFSIAIHSTAAYYGACSKCNCPGFSGSGHSCGRGGCGHHFDDHW